LNIITLLYCRAESPNKFSPVTKRSDALGLKQKSSITPWKGKLT